MNKFFEKSGIFGEKKVKNYLWENILTVLSEEGRLETKINISFRVDVEVLNIFHSTIFSKKKKKKIFSRITREKLFLGSVTIFEGTGRRTTKMNRWYNLLYEKWDTDYCFCFFFEKPHTARLKLEKLVLWAYFPSPISVVLLGRFFLKTKGFTHGWPRTNRANFMKIGSRDLSLAYLLNAG